MHTIADIAERMKQRGIGDRVIARVVRLNPKCPHPGVMLRGIHFAPTAKLTRWQRDDVSKGAIIREFGRDVWGRIPADCIRKDGKRAYITRAAYLDRVWMGRAA